MSSFQGLSFWDCDGTIYRGAWMIEIVQELVARGIWPRTVWTQIQTARELFDQREISKKAYHFLLVDAYVEHFKGIDVQLFSRVCQTVVDKNRYNSQRFSGWLIERLRSLNYFLTMVSASPLQVVEPFGRFLGFNKVFATILEEADGLLVGDRDIMHDENKVKACREIIYQHPNAKEKIFAFGDTVGDLPMLNFIHQQGGSSVCINPDKKLSEAANRNNWLVVLESSEVINFLRGREVIAQGFFEKQNMSYLFGQEKIEEFFQ
jgi:HAD superfamily phosphoserine phosphatase-like hydrolase